MTTLRTPAQQALWAAEVTRECLLEAGEDVDAGLAAAEYIIATQPLPPPINAPLAHDIHNKRAQAILDRTLRAARELSSSARKDLESALKADESDSGAAILAFVNKYRLQLTDLLTSSQLASVLEGAREIAAKVPQLDADAAAIGPIPLPSFPALSTDAGGREHRGKGKGGGQFTSKGKGGGTGSADADAVKEITREQDDQTPDRPEYVKIGHFTGATVYKLPPDVVKIKNKFETTYKYFMDKQVVSGTWPVLAGLRPMALVPSNNATNRNKGTIVQDLKKVIDELGLEDIHVDQFEDKNYPGNAFMLVSNKKVAEERGLTGYEDLLKYWSTPGPHDDNMERLTGKWLGFPDESTDAFIKRDLALSIDSGLLTTISEAARLLAEKNVLTRPAYDALDAQARTKAFTVAGVDAEETLTKIRNVLAENVAKGANYATFRKAVLEAVDKGTFLSDAHLETVFRTNVQSAFSDGQMAVLSNPLVRNGFPYATYDAIHDDRARHDHLALEKHGIEGTNVYRNDDPVFQMFRPPWDYNDRCSWSPITVRQAAERGIAEAKEWLRTGTPPAEPAFVSMPPFAPSPGFERAVAGAPLAVRLSLQPMSTFSHDVSDQPRDEGGKWTDKVWRYSDNLPPHDSWKDLEPEEGYIYHATSQDRAGDIQSSSHMVPQRPWFGTDQREWPDGSTAKRIYFSDKPATAWQFAPEGKPALLRLKKSKLVKPEGTGDFYLEGKKVPIHLVEILTEEGWKPLAIKDDSTALSISEDEYPRDASNRFLDRDRILEAARDPECHTRLRESLAEDQRWRLDRIIGSLQAGGVIHHPRENPGLAVRIDGTVADSRWAEYAEAAAAREAWEDRSVERNARLDAINRAVKHLRRNRVDLDEVDKLVKEAGATPAELRALARVRHREYYERIKPEEMEDTYEEVIEDVHQRIEKEIESDPEPPVPEEPKNAAVAFSIDIQESMERKYIPSDGGKVEVRICYTDDDGNLAHKDDATRAIIVQLDSKDNIVGRTYALLNKSDAALSTDEQGHEHRGKGKGGGQFTSKGRSGGVNSSMDDLPIKDKPSKDRSGGKPNSPVLHRARLGRVAIQYSDAIANIVDKVRHALGGKKFNRVRVGHIAIQYSDEGEEYAKELIEKLENGTISVPDTLLKHTGIITISPKDSNAGSLWSKIFGVSIKPLAEAGHGHIVIYRGGMDDQGNKLTTDVITHECAHNLAFATWGVSNMGIPPIYSAYGWAQRTEKPVTPYGATHPAEDFAEAVRLFVHRKSDLKRNFPKKYAAVKALLKPTEKNEEQDTALAIDEGGREHRGKGPGGGQFVKKGGGGGSGGDDNDTRGGDDGREHEPRHKAPSDGQGRGRAEGGVDAASGRVAGAPEGPDASSAGEVRQGEDQPTGDQTDRDTEYKRPVVSVVKEYTELYRRRGDSRLTDLMQTIDDHLKQFGPEGSLAMLDDEVPTAPGALDPVQYKGTGWFDENAPARSEAARELAFLRTYLNHNGIILATGDNYDPDTRLIASAPVPSAREAAKQRGRPDDVIPTETNIQTKLEESKLLPGLESTEDIHKIMGRHVSQFTPDVMNRLDEVYGKGKWIVKSYGDEAYAGFGVLFPQRIKNIKRASKEVLWDCNNKLKRYGFSLAKSPEGDTIGIKGRSSEVYRFGSQALKSLPNKAVQQLANIAEASAPSERGARLPTSPIDSLQQDYGVTLRKGPDGKVVSVVKEDGNEVKVGGPGWKELLKWDDETGHTMERAIAAMEDGDPGDSRFFVQPAFEAIGVSEIDRAMGVTWETSTEGRVHVVIKDGRASVVPYATLAGRADAMPAVFRNDDIRAMEKAAQDAIDALPESERTGQVYAPDVMKTKDGWRVVELNAAVEGGQSLWLEENPLVIDAYVSHITGRDPAHVRFVRNLLRDRINNGPPKPKTRAGTGAGAGTPTKPTTAGTGSPIPRFKKAGFSIDDEGREHKGKGPGGGQFVSKGEGGGSSSDTKNKKPDEPNKPDVQGPQPTLIIGKPIQEAPVQPEKAEVPPVEVENIEEAELVEEADGTVPEEAEEAVDEEPVEEEIETSTVEEHKDTIQMALAKLAIIPMPTEEEVQRAKEQIAKYGIKKYRRNLRSNSTDRRNRRASLMEEFGDGKACPCVYCGIKVREGTLEQDMIIGVEKGGRFRLANLVPSCQDCKRRRQRGGISFKRAMRNAKAYIAPTEERSTGDGNDLPQPGV